jgi:ATP-dependent exoDNAse (exonuclease V) beta subunit
MMNIKIISAGAGSGKTFRLTSEMLEYLKKGVRPSGIIATTFTKKAASELQERVRVKLLDEGMSSEANDIANALIGTVHGVCVQLLRRFAFEAGVSPLLDIMSDDDRKLIFNNALATTLTNDVTQQMNELCNRLGYNKNDDYDWQDNINYIVDVSRSNNLSISDLDKSKILSFQTLQQYIGEKGTQTSLAMKPHLEQSLMETISLLEESGDDTKVTATGIKDLRTIYNDLRSKGKLDWHQWVKIGKIKVGAKRLSMLEPLQEMAARHIHFKDFHEDIEQYIHLSFDLVKAALSEFEAYKKQRGIIDYTDMELLVLQLLQHESVCEILKEEIDLLMVDEFQDTSPIQLEIFLKLSKLAKESVWVGDPKQSIYGFRGADPKIMTKIISACGGVKPEDIQEHSYRSRPDIVHATNVIFKKAFPDLDEKQVALSPKREDQADMSNALKAWYFEYDAQGGRNLTDAVWFQNCIATTLKKTLEQQLVILPKDSKETRIARPGDVAILCRSNKECVAMADALHKAGLKAAIARNGLLDTLEIRLLLACLRYILSPADSLSIAEIMVLGSKQSTEQMLKSRMDYLETVGEKYDEQLWGKAEDALIASLDGMRARVVEYSGSVILDMILDELDLRRSIIALGNATQRLDNIEILRHFARQYEDNCHRLHAAASLGGMILWIAQLPAKGKDNQASAESPDAVQVMTYHKSKGLEWPIVICNGMEGKLKDNVWGTKIVSDGDIDLDHVLQNRWLRFWAQPYSDQIGNTILEQNIAQSAEQKDVTAEALAEDARVLYVGITRARDYLILPVREKKALEWLDRTFNPSSAPTPAFDVSTGETDWNWDGKILNFDHTQYIYPRTFASIPPSLDAFPYFDPRLGKKVYEKFFIKAAEEKIGEDLKYHIGEEVRYATALKHHESASIEQVIDYVSMLQIADNQKLSDGVRNKTASNMFNVMQLQEGAFSISDALQSSSDFYEHLYAHLDAQQIQTQRPLRSFFDRRCFETTIDYLIQTTDTTQIVVQNMNYAGEERLKRVKTLRNWAYYVKQSLLDKNKSLANIRFFINFPIAGVVIELVIE